MLVAFARDGFGGVDGDSDDRNHEKGKHRFKRHRAQSLIASGIFKKRISKLEARLSKPRRDAYLARRIKSS
jgi:lipid II:glycine glycyltransferase (peptidoglycan interpeptide bridge formation enzyme)